MNIQARLKQAEERAMLLQKKADTIHLIMVKPVPGKERLYTILGKMVFTMRRNWLNFSRSIAL